MIPVALVIAPCWSLTVIEHVDAVTRVAKAVRGEEWTAVYKKYRGCNPFAICLGEAMPKGLDVKHYWEYDNSISDWKIRKDQNGTPRFILRTSRIGYDSTPTGWNMLDTLKPSNLTSHQF